mmetsp:Transcript_2331/g.6219  ORF Transcript_2331/g.6219 Transcript_2331/m.6219 type:complete len:217 (+) Transcript_2331:120-770(+)
MKSLTSARDLILTLLVASIRAPSAVAFRSSVTTTPLVLTSFEPIKPQTEDPLVVEEIINEKTFKYDLGIGKNPPVVNRYADDYLSSLDKGYNPTQFLVEHETVRPYPSPLDLDFQSLPRNIENQNELKQRKRKNLPKVHHRRHSEDVLRIEDPTCNRKTRGTDHNNVHLCRPTIVPINRKISVDKNPRAVKLDVNTVWVEMMLHHEHSKTISNEHY